MFGKLNRLSEDESGITALETAIILIAFVVVASVFAFTILSAGTTTTEKSAEAIYAGLEEVRGTLELKDVIAKSDGSEVQTVTLTLSNAVGGQPIDLTTGSDAVMLIEYRDQNESKEIAGWSVGWRGYTDGDDLLEERELAELTIPLFSLSSAPVTNTTFVVHVIPPHGGVLMIERTTPPYLDPVMPLD